MIKKRSIMSSTMSNRKRNKRNMSKKMSKPRNRNTVIESSLTWNTSSSQFYWFWRRFWTFISTSSCIFLSLFAFALRHECGGSVHGALYLFQMTSEKLLSPVTDIYPLHSIDFIWPKLDCVTLNLSDHNIKVLSGLYGTSEWRNRSRAISIAIILRRGQSHPIPLGVLHSIGHSFWRITLGTILSRPDFAKWTLFLHLDSSCLAHWQHDWLLVTFIF
jgi:hypothetical protein